VLAFPQRTSHEIVVIDDCSPEPELSAYLRGLANAKVITLLENPVNTGFVNTVNRGMVLHPERDVVLLNSDTEVNGDWLDRLRRHAGSDPMIGTVTPFSNNATICSYPRFCENNLFVPAENRLGDLDALFAEINTACHVEIPTAVGFCMYITRHCIEQVGYFDAQRFGRGYGEENDFCLRGSEYGFQHLLGADTFVYHQGAVSFGSEYQLLGRHAMERLRAVYPFYEQLIASHVAADPARQLRRRVDWARLIKSGRPCLLFVTHQEGGGTEKHVQDLAGLLETQFEVLILRPSAGNKVTLEWGRRNEEFKLYFAMPNAFDDLVRQLQQAAIIRVHFHHLIGHYPLIASLPNKLRVPYDYTLHDHFSICPQFNLTLPDGRYCGEPDLNGCNACLKERPPQWSFDIITWRSHFRNLLAGAERVIGPSWDTINRIKKYAPEANFVYLPHPEPHTVKVLILGMMDPAKGALQLESCARDAKQRNLPMTFRVLGFANYEKLPLGAFGGSELLDLPISFSGPYKNSDLPALIISEQADVIYFAVQCPETYSYTLSAALRSNLPILAPRIGAFSERLRDYPKAYLIEWDTAPQAVNDRLLYIVACGQSEAKNLDLSLSGTPPSIYLQQYAVVIKQCTNFDWLSQISFDELIKDEYVYPELADLIIENMGRNRLIEIIKNLIDSPADRSLTWMAVKAWRDALLAKQEALLKGLADKEKALILAEQHQAEREQQLTEALRRQLNHERVIQQIYSSNSWRLTRPVRWLGRQYRRLLCPKNLL
jgi:GT2 family glycosyltransferase